MLCAYLERLSTRQVDMTLAVAQILILLSGKHHTWPRWKKHLKKDWLVGFFFREIYC